MGFRLPAGRQGFRILILNVMSNIILGLVIVIAGFLLVWKTEWIVANFGSVYWAEKHLGTEGGTRIFYKLLGIIIIVIGYSVMTNLLQPFLFTKLSPFFGG